MAQARPALADAAVAGLGAHLDAAERGPGGGSPGPRWMPKPAMTGRAWCGGNLALTVSRLAVGAQSVKMLGKNLTPKREPWRLDVSLALRSY